MQIPDKQIAVQVMIPASVRELDKKKFRNYRRCFFMDQAIRESRGRL